MSFTKYAEIKNKTKPNIIIVMDDYKEKLEADMASFILKPQYQSHNVNKYIINTLEISKILSEVNYPFSNKFQIALSTTDPKKVNNAYKEFSEWSAYYGDEQLVFKIKTEVFKYLKNIYNNNLTVENIDEIAQSILCESKSIVEKMSHNIEMAISKIPRWNYKVVLEAINPVDNLLLTEVKVIIGDIVTSSFIYENSLNGFNIKDIEEESPNSLNFIKQNLISKLNANAKYNNILTLYMNRPLSERKIYELAKRDLSLGIKAVLPEHIHLTDKLVLNELDIWKVKIDKQYLVEDIVNGNKQFNFIKDSVPIRWIERVINEE